MGDFSWVDFLRPVSQAQYSKRPCTTVASDGERRLEIRLPQQNPSKLRLWKGQLSQARRPNQFNLSTLNLSLLSAKFLFDRSESRRESDRQRTPETEPLRFLIAIESHQCTKGGNFRAFVLSAWEAFNQVS